MLGKDLSHRKATLSIIEVKEVRNMARETQQQFTMMQGLIKTIVKTNRTLPVTDSTSQPKKKKKNKQETKQRQL